MRLLDSIRRSPPWLALLAFCLLVVGAKFSLIRYGGSDLPYWDQWDAEGDRLLRPWTEGRLQAAEFFQAQNEHRIVFTQLEAFALAALNHQWDARVETTVNALLHVAALALLLAFVARHLRPLALVAFAASLAIIFGLPYNWENTLGGFQSQFYFVVLFGLLQMGGILFARPGSGRWWAAHLAGLAGIFSMASGFVASAVVIALALLRWLSARRRPTKLELASVAWCAALVVAGMLLRVDVPGHAALRAHSPLQWLESVAWLAAWPAIDPIAALAMVLPIGWATVRAWQERFAQPARVFVVALGAWWAVHVVLLAFARGGDSHGLSSRYDDTLGIGVAAGALSWLLLLAEPVADRAIRAMTWIAATIWIGVVAVGLQYQTAQQWHDILSILPQVNASRAANVRAFVRGELPSLAAKQPWTELPYPDAARLEGLLRHPGIRSLLPVSVRLPLELRDNTSRSTGFRRNGISAVTGAVDAMPWSSFERGAGIAAWTSAPLHTSFPLLRFQVAGELGPPEGELVLQNARSTTAVRPAATRRLSWGTLAVSAPAGEFRVTAKSASGHWLAFTAPVEMGRLSWLAYHAIKIDVWLIGIGGFLLAGMAALELTRFVSRPKAIVPAAPRKELLSTTPEKTSWLDLDAWIAPGAPHRLRNWIGFAIVLGVLLFLRKPHGLLTPQFWAEDSSVFFMGHEQLGWRALFEPYAGYLHLLPRLVAAVASIAPPVALPAVYTTVSFVFWWAVVLSLLSPRVTLPGKTWLALAAIVAPHTGEVLFQPTNLQWGTALLVFRQLFLRPAETRREIAGDVVTLLLVGLTGPFTVVLWPLFAWRTWQRRRQRAVWLELALVTLCAAAHIAAQLHAPFQPPAPSAPFNVLHVSAAIGQRVFGVPLFGWKWADAFGLGARASWMIGLIAIVGAVLWHTRRANHRHAVWLMLGALVLLLGTTLYRGGSGLWDVGRIDFGDRYYFLPRVLFFWIVIAGAMQGGRIAPVLAGALVWSVAIHLPDYVVPPQPNYHWADYAPKLLEPTPSAIPTPPAGWKFYYPGRKPHP
jgi:hypothetical protein